MGKDSAGAVGGVVVRAAPGERCVGGEHSLRTHTHTPEEGGGVCVCVCSKPAIRAGRGDEWREGGGRVAREEGRERTGEPTGRLR